MMDERLSGRILSVGDNVDTDMIVPGKYLSTLDPAALARHVLEGLDPSFPARIRPGDILAAGRNFGCGSSREHAPIALKAAGVSLILAESFARIFYRNAINIGLPALICPGVGALKEGESVVVDLRTGKVAAPGSGLLLVSEPLGAEVSEILAAGSLVALVRKKMEARDRGA